MSRTVETIPSIGVGRERTLEAMRRHGLRAEPEEIRAVAERVGRDLTVAEAFLIDVAFSEHCSYKSSRKLLKRFLPPLAPHVLLGPGEDAGVIDVGEWNGERWALVVAHESHNHPSQLLPIEGAATGIGGIVRDVYCMGADVVGVLDGLRFGDLDGPSGDVARAVARGVVRGIWEYGNALGVPNLGGDLDFDSSYDDNCLVNVVALGVAPVRRILRSRVPEAAREEPYQIVLVGKPTDRSGLGGASFASQVLDSQSSEQNLGAVQIHDPFLKRVLVEATKAVWDLLEERGCPSGFKDLGAGGFGGASSELLAAGGFGGAIDIEEMPVADPSILPEHLLVGETQERFVWALPARIVPEVLAIYNETFDLPGVYPGARAAVVGRVTPEKRYRVIREGEVIVDLPLEILGETPQLERPIRPRAIATETGTLHEPDDWAAFLERFLAHPSLCSRAHVYRHYDAEVRGEALLRPGEADSGVCRPIPGAPLGVAVTLDGNARWCDLDPYHGAVATVLETARNLVAVGARPRALTDCLNFGSPEDPECLWEFAECLRGLSDGARALGLPERNGSPLPIVSGNVSFYNQSASGRRIRPTPILAGFGTIEDWRRACTPQVKRAGSRLFLVADLRREWGGSPATEILGCGPGIAPRPEVEAERERIWGVLAAIEAQAVASCHDFATGGMLAGLIEMLLWEERPTGLGLAVDLAPLALEPVEALLSESGGFLLEVEAAREPEFRSVCRRGGIEPLAIGSVISEPRLEVRKGDRRIFSVEVAPLWKAWSEPLGPWMEGVER
ncbi:MAG: phosphoribosylformylglycinamidine synthase subunit PurL [Candidatus Eisenbacteria bacterium]